MTRTDAPTHNTGDYDGNAADRVIGALTLQRVREAMSFFDVSLHEVDDIPGVAGANLNGQEVTFAIVGAELIIRADLATGTPTAAGDLAWFVAANKFNTVSLNAKAAIVDRTEQLLARVEVEYDCLGGVTNGQLRDWVKAGVDTVLTAVDAVCMLHDAAAASGEGLSGS